MYRDFTPVGVFVEIEGSEDAIHNIATAFGVVTLAGGGTLRVTGTFGSARAFTVACAARKSRSALSTVWRGVLPVDSSARCRSGSRAGTAR